MKKRVLASLLSVCLIVGLFPAALAANETQGDKNPAVVCNHHTEHDEACGYTADDPVCAFVCAVCPVQQQINDLLAQF